MSSVEQKIREVLENISGSGGVKSIAIDQATQSILQIIESDVIGEDDGVSQIVGPMFAVTIQSQAKNELRAKQRANLREEKQE